VRIGSIRCLRVLGKTEVEPTPVVDSRSKGCHSEEQTKLGATLAQLRQVALQGLGCDGCGVFIRVCRDDAHSIASSFGNCIASLVHRTLSVCPCTRSHGL